MSSTPPRKAKSARDAPQARVANPLRVVRVAVPVPLHRLFDYSVPDTSPLPAIGARVTVNFAGRQLVAVCVQINPPDAHARPKPIGAVLDEENLFGEALWQLGCWMADYYQHPLGETFATMLPAAARRPKPLAIEQAECWQISIADADLHRAPKQAALYKRIQELGGHATARQLIDEGHQRVHLRALAGKGVIARRSESTHPQDTPAACIDKIGERPTLNPEQVAVLEALEKRSGFTPVLLDGITGSGKTEIYLRLMEEVLKAGNQVLVLVPEIALTPQTLSRFEQRFGSAAVMHSNMTDRARLQVWLKARSGEIRILIGTRSAVLTPFSRLGLIVVDEEHDSSFKQTDGLRYSARDVAVKRAQQLQIPLILGSATPSFESLHNASSGRYLHLHLTQRAGGATLPSYHLIDLRGHSLSDGMSDELLRIVDRHLSAGGQVLVFLNRRGFAPTLLCAHCGWQAQCAACELRMTMHKHPPMLICHHCGKRERLSSHCPQCEHDALIAVGVGTQRTEASLIERFPEVPVYRIDRDSTRSQKRMEAQFEAVRAGNSAILVGTQMLAKGHHFPDVSLVAIVNADGGFMSPDFRAPERTAQLIVQVAGRAGRAERVGEVYIQTYQPDNPQLRALIEQGYSGFAQRELETRAVAELPPFRPMALIRAESPQAELAQGWLHNLKQRLSTAQQPGLSEALEVYGPAPAIIPRVADRWRYQLLVLARDRRLLHLGLKALQQIEEPPRTVRWSLDIDPYDTF